MESRREEEKDGVLFLCGNVSSRGDLSLEYMFFVVNFGLRVQ